MRILHTADWHIGKLLQKYSLEEDHKLFFEWFLPFLEKECIDVLLISGDIFDYANPSNADRKLYYSFLRKLIKQDIEVVITGGNHDSITMLEAPKPILEDMRIHIIGGAGESPEDEVIALRNDRGETECILLAVPYLRDKDVRKALEGETYTEKVEEVRAGILAHYRLLIKYVKATYDKNLPIIAMGHLYVQGASTSDSERDIQIGNQAGVSVASFPEDINYFALGHIHRPQTLRKDGMVRYSGSPIGLSFSERMDHKQVVLLSVENNSITAEPRELPCFRKLSKISGSLAEVKNSLENYTREQPLPSLLEVEVKEKIFDPVTIRDLQELVASYNSDEAVIVKHHIHFENAESDIQQLYMEGTQVEDLRPMEVFEKRLASLEIEPEKEKMLVEAFAEILEEVQNNSPGN